MLNGLNMVDNIGSWGQMDLLEFWRCDWDNEGLVTGNYNGIDISEDTVEVNSGITNSLW